MVKKVPPKVMHMAMDMMFGSLVGTTIRKAIESGKSIEIVVRDKPKKDSDG